MLFLEPTRSASPDVQLSSGISSNDTSSEKPSCPFPSNLPRPRVRRTETVPSGSSTTSFLRTDTGFTFLDSTSPSHTTACLFCATDRPRHWTDMNSSGPRRRLPSSPEVATRPGGGVLLLPPAPSPQAPSMRGRILHHHVAVGGGLTPRSSCQPDHSRDSGSRQGPTRGQDLGTSLGDTFPPAGPSLGRPCPLYYPGPSLPP